MTFKQWFKRNLPDIRYFSAEEFLVKGLNKNGLNTSPPEELWPNVIPLAYALDGIRHHLGVPMRLHSVYRSPAYNRSIGGARSSQHMLFKAADWSAPARGDAADWAATVRKLRADGLYSGGLGQYKTFVHVDVRGSQASWMGKGVVSDGTYLSAATAPAPRATPQSADFPASMPTDDETHPTESSKGDDRAGDFVRVLVAALILPALYVLRRPLKALWGWAWYGSQTQKEKAIGRILLVLAATVIVATVFWSLI